MSACLDDELFSPEDGVCLWGAILRQLGGVAQDWKAGKLRNVYVTTEQGKILSGKDLDRLCDRSEFRAWEP